MIFSRRLRCLCILEAVLLLLLHLTRPFRPPVSPLVEAAGHPVTSLSVRWGQAQADYRVDGNSATLVGPTALVTRVDASVARAQDEARSRPGFEGLVEPGSVQRVHARHLTASVAAVIFALTQDSVPPLDPTSADASVMGLDRPEGSLTLGASPGRPALVEIGAVTATRSGRYARVQGTGRTGILDDDTCERVRRLSAGGEAAVPIAGGDGSGPR